MNVQEISERYKSQWLKKEEQGEQEVHRVIAFYGDLLPEESLIQASLSSLLVSYKLDLDKVQIYDVLISRDSSNYGMLDCFLFGRVGLLAKEINGEQKWIYILEKGWEPYIDENHSYINACFQEHKKIHRNLLCTKATMLLSVDPSIDADEKQADGWVKQKGLRNILKVIQHQISLICHLETEIPLADNPYILQLGSQVH
ncbi:MAG: hypothetical protein CL916_03030 [Deltaproteobacteria bacterium]|nr:hypothetical protein [Deltaproteobacteria bacterium]